MNAPQPENSEQTFDYDEIAEKIGNGEFFRDARNVYAGIYLDPMSERYLYVGITGLALLIFMIAVSSIIALFPLNTPVPFAYYSRDVFSELPRISPLARGEETANHAIQRFLVQEFVTHRESYSIGTLEINVRAVKGVSTDKVYQEWQRLLDPANPESPIALYERHSTVGVNILTATPVAANEWEVVYDAVVEGRGQRKKTRMAANITFRFSDITIDQDTGKMSPLEFIVTDYRTRRL